jgi:hypothetical protein
MAKFSCKTDKSYYVQNITSFTKYYITLHKKGSYSYCLGGLEGSPLLAGPGQRWMRDATMPAASCTPSWAAVAVA